MSSAVLSPTARILRSSRVLSLPQPINGPLQREFGLTGDHASPTGTQPFPTLASIVTPKELLYTGDWGLKRSMPRKISRRSANPVIRIKAMDSWAHITEFESAADHTRNVEKFQTLNLPISLPKPRRNQAQFDDEFAASVFEDKIHSVRPDSSNTGQRRWRFGGPSVHGMTNQEFDVYLRRDLPSRRDGFRDFLRNRLAQRKQATASSLAHEDPTSEVSSTTELPSQANNTTASHVSKPTGAPVLPTQITTDESCVHEVSEAEVDSYIEELRGDEKKLLNLVERFLDLPPPYPSKSDSEAPAEDSGSALSDIGPLRTHPSAGLSYLRSASYLANHPLLGPQQHDVPYAARIIRPRGHKRQPAKLGLAGFVALRKWDHAASTMSKSTPGMDTFRPDISGGAKIYVHPSRATIDSSGYVQIQVVEANATSQAIRDGSIFDVKSTNHRRNMRPSSAFGASSRYAQISTERTVTGVDWRDVSRRNAPGKAVNLPPEEVRNTVFHKLSSVLDVLSDDLYSKK